MKRVLNFAVIIALLSLVACADEVSDPVIRQGSLRIINQSQYQVQELRIHKIESYLGAANVLVMPMAVDEEHLFFDVGERYVTVFREKFRDGPLIAITTASPINLISGQGARLQIFDESFRVSDDEWIPSPSDADAGQGTMDNFEDSSVMNDSGTESMDAGTSTTAYQDAG